MTLHLASAMDIHTAFVKGDTTALEGVEACLTRIAVDDSDLNCFVELCADQARDTARRLDQKRSDGAALGPLAGVPFAVKDLFDVKGEVTKAGAKLRQAHPPADQNADLVDRLKAADAIYLGRLNMDEFAYGFATVNANYGTTRNPHDRARLAGGSSGGSAAAVAANFVPITLGSDTNGSVRVPASLCGLYGLRPTHGDLPMTGVFPFVEQLDTVGPFTRSIEDLALVYRVLADRPSPPCSTDTLKVARLDGWFRSNGTAEGIAGVDLVAAAFGTAPLHALPLAEAARSAAFLITAKYGGVLHLETLQKHAMAYDPAVRDRLIAGIVLDDAKVQAAEQIIAQFNQHLQEAFKRFDLLIAPTTPTPAPKISDSWIEIDGQHVSARANLGLYTQPLSVAGIPILTVPLKRPSGLPLGVQLIANPPSDCAAVRTRARRLQ